METGTKKPTLKLQYAAMGAAVLLFLGGLLLIAAGQNRTPGISDPTESTSSTTETTVPENTEQTQGTTQTTVPDTVEPGRTAWEKNTLQKSDFIKDGHFIYCTAETTSLCIDVSEWQGKIDWGKVRAAGVENVIIRAGYRGYGNAGTMGEDVRAQEYYQGAKAAGLKVGAYFFSQAKNSEEGLSEAQLLLEIIRDWEIDLPVVCDWEYLGSHTRVHGVSKRQITDAVVTFCSYVREAGYHAMFYCTNYSVSNKLYLEELTAFGIWFANYNDAYLDFPYKVDIWQYTDKGRLSGIRGNVDLNVIFTESVFFS